ncbi:phage tail tape measure protein [Shimwellia blattae]|uniref:Phage tail tape measure protein n=1 Tax=Shimwellia blattae (strain ATCC 29907 / DSM 4481 / JCM 1650 / NBRC 105725 / CDC 9005-74) TaxID=630626 RepID=I2B9D6_SHIBC|nr:phage tail tape measure protein [Shimwellia blattae]AFJ47140.1 phage tail tape measure protein [Shimwellia blattae DSM 4481 = NBRC 105725]GAB80740.1 putative phage tail tape measure protein [Shimwellia blattae DSM 4481 = NBRC 105725]VDY64633.1 phage tail tape measure protein, TP901 family, core region [Shimwellia blattae]VEC22740.1 phage tail tape measure protein, TP901 family, core region [Shimwellia blattae]
MGDIASLAVGLHLNAANFRSQLIGAYGDAQNSSGRFNRQARAEAKKTEHAYLKVGDAVTRLGGQLALLAGTGLSLSTIISTARRYGQALSDLQAITGITSEQLLILDAAARQMGAATEYSASQAAEALKLMASARPELLKTADGLQQATASALVLAQAAGTTLPDATRALALSLNQFGASSQQADRYINVLAAGAKYGASEIADTTLAIKNSGVVAAQAGIGFEQLNAAIQVLAAREIKGSESGTALRNVILALEKGTDKSLKPSVVGLSQALASLANRNLSTAQAVKLFRAENLSAASILIQNQARLDELSIALTGTKTAHEQASVRVNNLNGDLLGLSSAFEGLVIKIGQSSSGPLRSGIQHATEAINGLSSNFNTVASVALYTLIPVLTTKLTAGIRSNIRDWKENEVAVRAAARADADSARMRLASATATLKRNDAEFGYYRQMERSAKQHGLAVNYKNEFNRLIREETAQTHLATQAKVQLAAANRRLSLSARAVSVAAGLSRGALALVGGPLGAAALAASALFYFHNKAKEAKESAITLKDAVLETSDALMQLSLNQLNVKQLDLEEQHKNQLIQRNKLIKQIQDADTLIGSLDGFDPFGQLPGVRRGQMRARAELEAINEGLNKTEENIKRVGNVRSLARLGLTSRITSFASDVKGATERPEALNTGKPDNPWSGEESSGKGAKSAVNQYRQLRRAIEEAHGSSLDRINLQEQESHRQLTEAARKEGVSATELQRTLLWSAENYQAQRMALAGQYSPARDAVIKEQHASRELESLLNARLLTEREYQAARVTLAHNTTREMLHALADSVSAPGLIIAADVDSLAQLDNQLNQRRALLQAYYQAGHLNKERYEMLLQQATKESADAQYQTALGLYRSQGELSNLAIGLIETTQERATNMLTGLLMRTQTFKESMVGLFASLSQAVIKNLVDMAVQAVVTSTVLQSIMGAVGAGIGAAGGAASASASASAGTALQSYASTFQFNAKGGVYDSPSLSAYSNAIYDSPQFFAFAKGAGVFAENGPEAIMPLSRGPDGSLGVRAVGAPSGASASPPQVYITIEGNDNVSSRGPAGYQQFGQQVGKFVEEKYQQLLAADMRPGGAIWNAVKGR